MGSAADLFCFGDVEEEEEEEEDDVRESRLGRGGDEQGKGRAESAANSVAPSTESASASARSSGSTRR